VLVLIFFNINLEIILKSIHTVQAMRKESFHKTNNLHVQHIYMTSVHCYMFRRSTAIFRGPRLYL